MFTYRRHFFVCLNNRPPTSGRSCGAYGAEAILARLRRELDRRRLTEAGEVTANGSTCLGLCDDGPTIVVYPEGVWYRNVTADDVPEIVERHAVRGEPVDRLRNPDVETRADGGP